MTKNKIIINENNAGIRLDIFLFKLFPNLSHSQIWSFIRKRKVRINGKRVIDNNYRLQLDDIITYYFFGTRIKPKHEKTSISLSQQQVFYEDDDLLLVYKDYGIIMHSHHNSLNNMVNQYLQNKGISIKDYAFSVHHVHRIDRETKGLVIYAKTRKAQQYLYKQFQERRVIKGYYAVIANTNKYAFTKWTNLEGYILYNKGYFVKLNSVPTSDAKYAKIKIRKIKALQNKFCLLQIQCLTGRKHQIRILLSENETPIINDHKYGLGKKDNLLLFSYLLKFNKEKTINLKQYYFEITMERILGEINEIMNWK